MEMNQIYNEDCLIGMKRVDDKSIDMILCDLPYGTTKNLWDSVIDLDLLWEQYKRIIKDNGAIVLTAQTPFDKILGCSNLEWLKYEWIWNKKRPTGFLNAKHCPMKLHENILVFSKKAACFVKDKESAMPYYPQGVTKMNKKQKRTKGKGNYDEKYINNEYIQETTNYPKSILEFAPETGLHPTQKPVNLFEYLIKTYTNEGDLILDNCIGSGTTAISALNTNRNFIGFEKEKKYYDLATKRIEEHKNILRLF